MTIMDSGARRLAPDAAPGSPFTNNLIEFPVAACFADDADIVKPKELTEIEAQIAPLPDDAGKRLVQRFVATVRRLNIHILDLTSSRAQTQRELDELQAQLRGE